ncbi:Oligopeptide transport ATP-binding protein OppD [compost metagenome]
MLALIDEQVRLRGMGLILISHDLDLVARYADRVIVMYAGRVMEELPAGGMALAAAHPYTRGLMACRPSLNHLGEALPVLERDPAWLN